VPRNKITTDKGFSKREKERLLHEYKGFILRTASVVLNRYVSESDDAWSVALIAFSEALDQYKPEKGNFEAYARLVIRRRLIDDMRRQRKYQYEIDVPPQVFSGSADPAEEQMSSVCRIVARNSLQPKQDLQEEISEASSTLTCYGFSFWDLVSCCPKAGKTRAACTAAVRHMLHSPDLIQKMKTTRRLPICAIASGSRTPLKLLARHRKYIIAVVEILTGDYPGLSQYLESIGKGENA